MVTKLTHPLPPRSTAEEVAYGIVGRLRRDGHESYTVGGAVRDRLLRRTPHEVDVATAATPAQVAEIFPRTVSVGAAFGVVVVVQDDAQVEVATFREDGDYGDGRHPDSVRFADAGEDAARRDFTVNGLFYDPEAEAIVDFVGGLEDLRRGVIRAIGAAGARFQEDYLRMLRAVRFTAALDFTLDPATMAAIREHAQGIDRVSPERIFTEFTKMLVGPNPDRAFELLDESGLLACTLPELTALKGLEQPPQFHPEGDVWVHTLLLLRGMVHPGPALAWATLLHDLGKAPTFKIGENGRETFPGHADEGAAMTRRLLRRLRASGDLTEQAGEIVRHHMSFINVPKMRQSTLRRLLARPTFGDELEMHRLDCLASHGKLDNYAFCLDELRALGDEPPVPPPLVSGRDVMALGVPQSPRIGELLRDLQELQLNGKIDTREDALAWLETQCPQQ